MLRCPEITLALFSAPSSPSRCSNAISRSLGNFPFCSSPSLLLPSGPCLFCFPSAGASPSPPTLTWTDLWSFRRPRMLDRDGDIHWVSPRLLNPSRQWFFYVFKVKKRLMFDFSVDPKYLLLLFWLLKGKMKIKVIIYCQMKAFFVRLKFLSVWPKFCGSSHWKFHRIWLP